MEKEAVAVTINVLEWVERLGGWAVVLLVVRWFMERMDRRDKQVEHLIESFEGAIRSFEAFEKEERVTHQAILTELRSLREARGA